MSRRFTLAALGLALSPVAGRLSLVAQQQPLTAAELAAPAAFDPLVTVDTLPNGLVYYIRENRYPEHRAELRLAVRAGSVLEDDDQRGLAHVAEHMAFNGTTSFPKNDLIHYLQSIGSRFGADINAYTSFDQTVYMLEVPTDTGKFLTTGVQILSEWAHGVTYDPAEIDAERGVVSEEWRLGRGASARMRDQQFPVLFRGSRYADRMIIGTLEGLQGFTHDALTRFYHKWYRPDMMAVVAVGDFDKDSVAALIRRDFGGIPRPDPLERPEYPVPAHDSLYVTIATDPEATNSSFTLYGILPRRSYATMRSFRDRYVEALGLSMLNARYAEITQKPNPPFAFAAVSRGYLVGTADAFSLFGGVKEGEILTGLRAALTEAERVRRFGFTETELTRTIADRAASQEQSYNDRDKQPSSSRADELVRHFINGEEVLGTAGEYRAYQRINPTVTLAEVNAAAKALLTEGSPVIAVNAPARAGVTVPTAAQVREVYLAVRDADIQPYRDSTVSNTLMASIPEPAAITAERTLPAVEATEWTLANGVKVVLKPTDYKNDEVVLRGTSPGGTSLYPDTDFPTANFADNVIGLGGVGTMSAVDLRKALSGKNASATASIGQREESISARSSAKDIETMLQLVYLRFTAPREDTSAFQAYKQSMQAMLANAAASPQMAFLDTVTTTITQGSPRAPVMRPTVFDSIDLDRAMAIYKDRFADASDFTFFVVGSFSLDSIRPLVQRYLGNLPSIHRVEAPRDIGPEPPTGRIEKVVRKGSEPQSMTIMVITQPWQWDAEENYVMTALSEVLSNRLLDNLREKLGGTYSVNAMVQGNRDFPHMTMGMVQFGSAPDRADELEQAVLAEIRAIADSGPSEAELTKVREGQLRARETALKTNTFWMIRLAQAYEYGDDPAKILDYDKLVEGLTAEKIRDAARKYLMGDNYIRVVLKPAEVTP